MHSPLPGVVEPELPTHGTGTSAIAAPSSLSYIATSSSSGNSHATSSDMEVTSATSRKHYLLLHAQKHDYTIDY